MAWGSVGGNRGIARRRRNEVWSVPGILWNIESKLTIPVVLGHVGSSAVVIVLKVTGAFARGTVWILRWGLVRPPPTLFLSEGFPKFMCHSRPYGWRNFVIVLDAFTPRVNLVLTVDGLNRI